MNAMDVYPAFPHPKTENEAFNEARALVSGFTYREKASMTEAIQVLNNMTAAERQLTFKELYRIDLELTKDGLYDGSRYEFCNQFPHVSFHYDASGTVTELDFDGRC